MFKVFMFHCYSNLFSYVSLLQFLSSLHPLSGHVRAALQRERCLAGLIPTCAIAVFDATLSNLCKSLDLKVESNPFLIISYVMRAAAELSGFIASSEGELWIRRQSPYPPEIIELSSIQQNPNNPKIIVSPSNQQPASPELLMVEAIIIPCSLEKNVERVILNITSSGYYLDVIGKQLGLLEAADLMISKPIGKASSETRLHFAAPKQYLLDTSSDLHAEEVRTFEGSLNARASYLSGQDIFGDAILATIGYTWRSKDLFYEDVSVKSYYRMFIGKTPSGLYKLSRGAILAAELPVAFTTNAKWKGLLPREMLCTFCRQHQLSQPIFSTLTSLEESTDSSQSHKKLRVTDLAAKGTQHANGSVVATDVKEIVESGGRYRCELKCQLKNNWKVNDFEFEIASGALNPHLESVLIQMSVGQSACFIMDLPPRELIFAAADDSTRMLSLLSSKTCCLEYTKIVVGSRTHGGQNGAGLVQPSTFKTASGICSSEHQRILCYYSG
ncbi:hypothetical protein ACLB2K_045411 [Fragaria x ananassa]